MQKKSFYVVMVGRVSVNYVRETPSNSSLSWLNWKASQFVMAIMDAVSSQAFPVSTSAPYDTVACSVGNAVKKMHTEFTYDHCFDNM